MAKNMLRFVRAIFGKLAKLPEVSFMMAVLMFRASEHSISLANTKLDRYNIITASLAAVLSSSVQLYNVKTSKLYDHHNWLLASIRDNANAVEGDADFSNFMYQG
ncbi:hypothetical protein T08_15388 [Trichinella sp. T8]|nr:hypothetical protein T08_15388 [Trichinella sp. T8]